MIWTKTNAYQVICRRKNAAILNRRLVQNNTFMKNWLLNLINKRNNGKDFLIFYCLTKNNDKICSRFQAISILLAKRTRLSRQNFFCRSQDKIFVFRTGCDVKFSGRIGKKMSASLGPPLAWFKLNLIQISYSVQIVFEIDTFHVPSGTGDHLYCGGWG